MANASHSLEDFRYFVSLVLILLFAAIPHIIFIFAFIYTQHIALAILNTASTLAYLLFSRLLRRKKYTLVIFLICLEVTLFAFLSTVYFGVDAYFQWYILLIIPPYFLFLNTRNRQAILSVSALYICLILINLFDQWFVPYYTGRLTFILRIVNLNIVAVGIIFELSLSLIVKSVVDSIYFKDLEHFRLASWQDPLTGLYNRRYAEKYFQDLVQEKNDLYPNPTTCFAMVDIDDFKHINDTYGHAAGDKVLESLAALFKASLRNSDLIIRWGGEEFLIVLSGTNMEQARVVVDNLRQKVEHQRLPLSDHKIAYTITAGLSELEDMDVETAIQTADQNLYKGKQAGKNQVTP